jgi:uncharacterized protein (DUF1810 family)
MWWIFPQPFGAWGSNTVSQCTEYYSIRNKQELFRFFRIFGPYYQRLLKILLQKKCISSYLGPIDTIKFKSHLEYAISLHYQDLEELQKDLLLKIQKE